MSELFKISAGKLLQAARSTLANEGMIENWVRDNPALVGLNVLILGQQVQTPYGGRIDLLGLTKDGSPVVIELKRDRTPREIVAQVLDYASWVANLTTRDIHMLCETENGRSLSAMYQERFGGSPPDVLNATHQMMIIAGSMDEATKRIVEYLSQHHDIGINVSFFNLFEADGSQWMTTDLLLEQEEVTERATRKARGPWSGFWYLTAGAEEAVPWADLREYGYVVASGGKWYSDGLARLSKGDRVFFYQKNTGYLGFGVVTHEMCPAQQFMLTDGRMLVDTITRQYFTEFAEDPEKQAFVVGIDWMATVDRINAKTFPGIFANQNIACKLYDEKTADFLATEFAVNTHSGSA